MDTEHGTLLFFICFYFSLSRLQADISCHYQVIVLNKLFKGSFRGRKQQFSALQAMFKNAICCMLQVGVLDSKYLDSNLLINR